MSSDTDAACVATALAVFKTCQVILMLLVWPIITAINLPVFKTCQVILMLLVWPIITVINLTTTFP